jgi:L-iditol 2-dehydrogenase
MFTRLLQLEGYRVIATDLVDERLQVARSFGAAITLRGDRPDLPAEISRVTRQQGIDAAVVCAPSDDAVRQAQAVVNGAGKVLLFAHTRRGATTSLDLSDVCVDEKDLIGSYSSDLTLQSKVARIIFSGKLNVEALITHRFPLEQTAAAVELAAHPTAQSLKVIVDQTGR